MKRLEFLIRASMGVAVIASLVWAAIPAARHMAGIVVLAAPTTIKVPPATLMDPPDLGAILALAPFGRAPAEIAANTPQTSGRPTLVLRGIFAAKGAPSTALLDVDGVAGLYRTSAPVGGTLKVTRIARDLVVLADSDGTLTLRLDAETEATEPEIIADVPSLSQRLQAQLVVPAKYEKPGRPETTAEYIDYWRQRIRKNPQAVLDEIGLQATEQGYVIAERHDPGVRLAGLRSGDLVRTVNGQQVGDPNSDRRFYDQIAAAGQARIEVERGGRILSFSFPLR